MNSLRGRTLLVAMAAAIGLSAQDPPQRTAGQIKASYDAHRADFDYLLGDWEFTTISKRYGAGRGAWSAVRLAGGQIMDEFRVTGDRGETYYVSTTIRSYNAALDRWELVTMEEGGGLQDIGTGQRSGAEVHIEQRFGVMMCGILAQAPCRAVSAQNPSLLRIRYYNIGPNRFSWSADRSSDGGETWITDDQKIEAPDRAGTFARSTGPGQEGEPQMKQAGDPKEEFIDAAVWHGSLDRAEAILAEHPETAGSDIHVAAILGDDAAVRRFLEADPRNATAEGGPRGWNALTHLCFSKYLRLDRARSDAFLRAATVLLDAGASANTGFYDPNHRPHPTLESVLYGAAGVAHHPELTRLLLERGADPNDGEVAYHTPETLDNRAMKVLVESGKLTPDSMALMLARKFDWHDDDGVAWLLLHGADANFLSRWGGRPLQKALQRDNPLSYFELLLDRGADPTLPDNEGRSAFALAGRMARADVLDLFARRGFQIDLHGDDAFLAACTRADQVAARALTAADPGLVQRLQSENSGLLVDFAGAGNTDALRVMLDLGFDAGSARSHPPWLQGETALHVSAERGRLANVNLLIERGAPLEAVNCRGDTPLAVAVRGFVEQSEWNPNESTIEIARALINAGARVEPLKMTLAAAVCLGRAADVARLTKEAGAADRQMALAAAAFNGLANLIPALIALGADPNALNAGLHPHATALHNAVCSGSLDTVQALVDAGAKVDAGDTAYQATPLRWAEYFVREQRDPAKQDAAIVEYLREKEKQQ